MVENAKATNAPKADVLISINAISTFANRSYRTLLRLKQQYPGMPMTKDGVQGIWWADPDRLRQFLKDVAAGQGDKWMVAPETVPQLAPEPDGDPDKNPAGEPKGGGEKGDKGRG